MIILQALENQTSILNATVCQRKKFIDLISREEKLDLVEIPHWAGLGGVCYIPPELQRPKSNEETDPEDINPVIALFGIIAMFLQAILTPLQGFFNAMIYLKPFYGRFRLANPNKSKWWALKEAIMNAKAPRVYHRRIANHVTHRSDILVTDVTLGEDRFVNPNELLFYPKNHESILENFTEEPKEDEHRR